MEKVLKLYKYVDENTTVTFPDKEDFKAGIVTEKKLEQAVIYSFKYTANRMGSSPTITAKLSYKYCLDDVWSKDVYAEFNGEKYYIRNTPSSSKSNTDERYEHEIELLSERDVLNQVYFIDAVQGDSDTDVYKSNSTKILFFGDIVEFVARLNASFSYLGLTYSAVIDSGVTSEAKQVSIEDKYISEALQEIFNIYELPYYFVGKVIHIGFTTNAIPTVFRYGHDDALLSISKNNANYKVYNQITGIGSSDNIPYYYPNESDDRSAIEASGKKWITPTQNLMPSIYRTSKGAKQFYDAINNTYEIPGGETGDYYVFENVYSKDNPQQGKVSFDDIMPSITGVTNGAGENIDTFLDFAYDTNDNDEVDDEGNYLHPYFFAKLKKTNGSDGFNLFEQAIEQQPMQISMTSGVCGACVFEIGVGENTNKNTVQVDAQGNLLRDENGDVRCGREGKPEEVPQDRQNDTENYEVWLALKKDNTTYPQLMPNKSLNYRPSTSDKFVILGINLPLGYITAAEKRLDESLIKYMWMNNREKFTFSIKFSRIYFEENKDVLNLLNENARVTIEYNGITHTLYIDNYAYSMDGNSPLPEIDIDLVDTLTIGKNSLQQQLDSVKQDILSSIGGGDFLMQGLKYFIRKDVADTAMKVITFMEGIRLGSKYIKDILNSVGNIGDVDTDASVMSIKRMLSTFIRKDAEDSTNYLLSMLGGAIFGEYLTGQSGGKIDENGAAELLNIIIRESLKSNNFSAGALGSGLFLGMDENGDSYLEVDRMLVRKLATFVELLIQQLRYSGGQIILTPAAMKCSKVEEFEDYYRCYFETTDGERTIAQEFVVGDQARCQTFNVKEGINENVSNAYYWRLVVGTGDNYIDLSKTDCDSGSTVPEAGQDIVLLGNRTDATRQAAIVLSAYGEDAPYIKLYRGINSYQLSGKEFISFSRTQIKMIADELYFSTGESVSTVINGVKEEVTTVKDIANSAQDTANNAMESVTNIGDKVDNLKLGFKNLVSRKMMLKWNEKNSNIAVWGQDADGVYLGISGWQLFQSVVGGNDNLHDIFLGKGNYKANTQYVLSVEWKLAGAQDYQGLMFYIEYTDGSRDFTQINKDQTTLIRADVVTAKGKTIQKIYSAYGTNTYRTLIYALSLVEGNVIPLEIPTAEEDIWRSEVNLVDGGKEVTIPAVTSGEYNYKELIVPVLKPNTVYTVKVEDIEVLAGNPEGFDATIYFQSPWLKVANWLTLSSGKKYGLLITTNDFSAGEGVLLLYAGIAGATAGNSVRYTGISLVEGFYPPTAWRPSQGDLDKEIQEVSNALTNLDTTINGAFKDGIINEAEAKAIASNINILNAEKKDVDAQYTELYGNTYLTGAAKTNLQSAKTAYNTAHTNLINGINTAISDGIATATEKTDIDNKFTAYSTALGTYRTRAEEANKAIQDEIKRQADEAAQEKVDEEAELAKWRAIGYSWNSGKPLWTDDPTFKTGTNGLGVYDNSGNATVTITREAKQSDSPVSDSEYNLKIVCSGGAIPDNGGFLRHFMTRANAVFVFRFIAKLPEGTGFNFNYNDFGTGQAFKWVTSTRGTGRFEEYICVAKCGATGSFSTIGYFSIWGTAPVTCYLAYAGAFDVTAGVSTGEQLQTVSGTVVQLDGDFQATKKELNIWKEQIETDFTALEGTTKEQVENAVLNLQKGMRNLVLNGKVDIEGSTSYYVHNFDLSKALVAGNKYTLVMSATVRGSQQARFYDNLSYNQQISFVSGNFTNGVAVKSFTYNPNSGVTNHAKIKLFNYPSETAAANPLDLEWVCLYEGDITDTAPDYFVNAPEDLNLEINSVKQSVSEIEQTAENISLRVTTTETKVDAAQEAADNAMDKYNNLKIGMKNLVSFKHMLSWNDKAPNKNIAIWGQDADGVYLGISGRQLFQSVVGGNDNLHDIFLGKGNYKANTQYVLSVEWKLAGAQDYQGLMFYIEYTDGSRDFTQINKDQTTLIRADVVTAKGKTIQKIYSAYGTSTYRTLIYALSLVEGNTPPVEIPTAEEDIWRSEVNLVDGGKEVTLPVVTSGEYNHKELIVTVLKPNTVYTVSVEGIEVLAGNPEVFDATIYFQSPWLKVANWLTLSSGKKYGLLITTNDFSAGEGVLLLYAGRAGSTAGNSVRYTGISLVEGFYPPTMWLPSNGDIQAEVEAAQQAASDAQEAATAAQSDATEAKTELTQINSDSVISPVEKTALKQQQADIQAEYNEIIADAGRYSISTTAYKNAYTSANNALTKYTATSPTYITIGSDYANIAAYYDARQTILNSIAAAAKKASDAADAKADNAQTAADSALDAANDALNASNSGKLYVKGTGYNTGGAAVNPLRQVILNNNGLNISMPTARGMNLITLNRSDLSVGYNLNYDYTTSQINSFIERLNSLADNVIVILTSKDTFNAEGDTLTNLLEATSRCGGSGNAAAFASRVPYALVGIPGIGKGAGIEVFTSSLNTAPAAEISTQIINGIPVGISTQAKNMLEEAKDYTADRTLPTWRGWIDVTQDADGNPLDENKYYPLTIRLSSRDYTNIRLKVNLNSGTKPSWSTHHLGFTVNCEWNAIGCGWGVNPEPLREIIDYSRACTNTETLKIDNEDVTRTIEPAASIGQLTRYGYEHIYLRGGGKYYFEIQGITYNSSRTEFAAQDIQLHTTTFVPNPLSPDYKIEVLTPEDITIIERTNVTKTEYTAGINTLADKVELYATKKLTFKDGTQEVVDEGNLQVGFDAINGYVGHYDKGTGKWNKSGFMVKDSYAGIFSGKANSKDSSIVEVLSSVEVYGDTAAISAAHVVITGETKFVTKGGNGSVVNIFSDKAFSYISGSTHQEVFNINNGVFAVSDYGDVHIGKYSSGGAGILYNYNTSTLSLRGSINITSGSISINNGVFKVTNTGAMTATSGKIGEFSIGSTALSGTNLVMTGSLLKYERDNNFAYVGGTPDEGVGGNPKMGYFSLSGHPKMAKSTHSIALYCAAPYLSSSPSIESMGSFAFWADGESVLSGLTFYSPYTGATSGAVTITPYISVLVINGDVTLMADTGLKTSRFAHFLLIINISTGEPKVYGTTGSDRVIQFRNRSCKVVVYWAGAWYAHSDYKD